MNVLKAFLFLLMFLTVFFQTSAFSQKTKCSLEPAATPNADDSTVRSPFRYVIVAGVSNIEKYVNSNKDLLYLEVLMEDKAFDENNLKCLFELLSNRFTERPGLLIHVVTSLDAVKTPEENDHSGLKGPVSNIYKYKHAVYNRNDKCDERFEYSIPNIVKNKLVYLAKCER